MKMVMRGLRGLGRFSGRDTQGQFWLYAGVVTAGCLAATMAITALLVDAMFQDAASKPASSAFDGFLLIFWVLGGFYVVVTVLLAAAVTRRLHDRGLTGLIGLMPLPFAAFSLVVMPKLMVSISSVEGDVSGDFIGLFAMMFVSNILYMAGFIGLVILLALPGQPKANRYGEVPAA